VIASGDCADAIGEAFDSPHAGALTPRDRGADDVVRDVLTTPHAEVTKTAGLGDIS